jgi:hypothetical protein
LNFKSNNDKFILGLGLFSIFVLFSTLLFANENISITAQKDKNYDNKENEKNNNAPDLTTIKTKINLNNINIKNHERLKLVAYLNGEGQTTYIDLKDIKDKINLKDNSLTVNLKFNKSNDISQVMFDDEYYVCGYVIDNDKLNTANTKSNLTLYDCDEGNISLTSTDIDTVKLSDSTKITPKEVKLQIDVPIHDNKKINDMYLVAMIKGEYQIKKIDAQQEIEKEGNNERLSIPFTFNRDTEVGLIEPGDMFFGCVTSDEFPDQNSDCEKRIITDLSKAGQVCARLDSVCK